MRVLAVDPGYDRAGVAVLERASTGERLIYSACIETDKSESLPERLHKLGTEFSHLLQTHEPDCVGIETLFFNKNVKTAVAVAQARGVLIYLAMTAGCTVYEFGPQEIKVAVTGYGKSDKAAVINMVQRLIPTAPLDALDDEYDAIAVGITCLAHHR
ncbi:MAG: crossover junction endodeoxyribonuclease RuvC [Bacteroidota bacterium]